MEDGTVDSKSSSISDFSPDDGDLIMVRCLMSAHVGEDDDSYRGKIYSTHIATCVNVASLKLVKKLNLPTLAHPKSYKLH
ncbi:hypothetical protein CR513_39102, partial [Mucuna pruriens]